MQSLASGRAKSGLRLPRLHLVQVTGSYILTRGSRGGLWEEVHLSMKDLPPHWVILDAVAASLEAFSALA